MKDSKKKKKNAESGKSSLAEGMVYSTYLKQMNNKEFIKEVWKNYIYHEHCISCWKQWNLESLELSRHQMLRPSPELNQGVNLQALSQISSQACGWEVGITREAKGTARIWAVFSLEQLSQNLRMRNLSSGDFHAWTGSSTTDLVTPTSFRR